MLFTKPERVAFESTGDVIDYISKGFPPRQAHFDKVMEKLRNPDEESPTTRDKKGKEVIILDSVISPEDRKTLDDALTRIYRNQVRNRNYLLGGVCVVALGVLCKLAFSGGTKKRDRFDEDFEDFLYSRNKYADDDTDGDVKVTHF